MTPTKQSRRLARELAAKIEERMKTETIESEFGPEARETLRIGDGVARALLREQLDATAATGEKLDALEARIIERARRAGMTEQQIRETLRGAK